MLLNSKQLKTEKLKTIAICLLAGGIAGCYTHSLMYTELFETVYPINSSNREKGALVTAVDPLGLGDLNGIEPGDRITKVNGSGVRDFLDFQFYTGSEDLVKLEIARQSGETRTLAVEIPEGRIWGLDFEYFSPRQCANDCIFCFCNQNPKGSRDSLFFKDEDVRLSFLHGNYTTMSSISKMELDRIVEQRLSPQYVSVHSTDPRVRMYLLGRKRPDDVLAKMRYLIDNGIELHAQIVLCPTINDGEALNQTLGDLAELHPGLTSVAIVPVVFTKLHNYHHLLTPVTDEYAASLVRDMPRLQRDFRNRFGSTFAFLADEFYLRARLALPGAAHYGDYPQIEDGVGMVRRFISSARRTLGRPLTQAKAAGRGFGSRWAAGTIVTGRLFHPILTGLVDELNERNNVRLKTVALENGFFGEEVTVAGLLAGGDLLRARDKLEGDFVVVPEQACLKSGHIFLDDLCLEDLSRELGKPVLHGGPTLSSMVERVGALLDRASPHVDYSARNPAARVAVSSSLAARDASAPSPPANRQRRS